MVASETTNVILTTPSIQVPYGGRELSSRGRFGFALSGLVTAAFILGGAPAWAAEAKSEPKAEPKTEAKDGKGGKGDSVIESELRKALIGKSALTGELLMKTGDDAKPAPEKSSAATPARAKDSKEPKTADAAVGKKIAMPGADAPGAHDHAAAPAGNDHAAPSGHEKGSKGKPHWGYTGAVGPDAWAKLSAEFATCAKGRRQSPIDLVDRDFSALNLEKVKFEYSPAAFQVVHNGHTVEVRPAGVNQIVARSKNYKLLQFHFHHPAEERFNGKGFALDAHFVHRAEDGELAVVTVLFEEGAANPELQRLWDYMPLDSNDSVRSSEGVTFNPLSMLPTDRAKYLQYIGSLTTPPCTEGVVWIVLRQPVTASAEQIALFRKMVGMNARPVQPVNGRLIKASN